MSETTLTRELSDPRMEVIEDAPLSQIITDEFIRHFEEQARLYQEKYLPICCRLTNENDWVNHGTAAAPKYSLQASGAEKICNPLGIVWERPAVVKHERADEKGQYYEYEVEGIMTARVLKRYGWFTGNCSSRDPFFNARGRFEEGDIRKAAFSNWLVNGVARLAGIRNPTKALLEKAGLNPITVGAIDYSGNRTQDSGGDKISEGQQKRLWAIFKGTPTPNEDAFKKGLAARGYNHSKDILKKDYDAIVKWVEGGCKLENRNGHTNDTTTNGAPAGGPQ
jgi:hypothetical protein